MWLWSSLLPFFQFYSVFFEMDGPDTEDTGELCIHKVKEILCFVLCPLASSSQLCIWFMDCYWVCTGKASQPVCGSSRHQAVITVIQNKRFPNLWKRDYIWLICVSATIFGLKSNMAETRCAEFYNCWLQLRSSWAADKRTGCDYGPLWATNRHLLNVINRSPQVIEVLDCQKEHFLLSG